MALLVGTLSHLIQNVLPAATEYQSAEDELSHAYQAGQWVQEALTAKRKAAELAVAIDGMSDRAGLETKCTVENIRSALSALCFWPGSKIARQDAFLRVHSVANAYKHSKLARPKHAINSFEDVLVVGLGFGLDAYGVGKYGGVEVLIRDKSGTLWKFLGDAPTAVCAWFRFLRNAGAVLPTETHRVCGVKVHP
jgi:hypothetical protein